MFSVKNSWAQRRKDEENYQEQQQQQEMETPYHIGLMSCFVLLWHTMKENKKTKQMKRKEKHTRQRDKKKKRLTIDSLVCN